MTHPQDTSTSPRTSAKTAMERAVDKLNLSEDTKAMIKALVKDPPPAANTKLVGDALARGEIASTVSVGDAESQEAKAIRLALWALVYFPKQPIAYHMFLTWAGGTKITKDNQTAIDLFCKNTGKMRKRIEEYGLHAVAYITLKENSHPNTVDGFRLTADGVDYVKESGMRARRRVRNSMNNYVNVLSDNRLRLSDVKDAGYRTYVANEKEIASNLEMVILPKFTEVPRLAPAKKSRKSP